MRQTTCLVKSHQEHDISHVTASIIGFDSGVKKTSLNLYRTELNIYSVADAPIEVQGEPNLSLRLVMLVWDSPVRLLTGHFLPLSPFKLQVL
jgi:hypothetical protein